MTLHVVLVIPYSVMNATVALILGLRLSGVGGMVLLEMLWTLDSGLWSESVLASS